MERFIRRIKKKGSIIWTIIEYLNNIFVLIFFYNQIQLIKLLIQQSKINTSIEVKLCENENKLDCITFLTSLTAEDTRYFNPFPFNDKTINSLIKKKSYLLFFLYFDSKIIGMFFLRFFCNGKAYLGFIIADQMRGKGIGTIILKLLRNAFKNSDIKLYSTISKYNIASRKAHINTGFKELYKIDQDYSLFFSDNFNNSKEFT